LECSGNPERGAKAERFFFGLVQGRPGKSRGPVQKYKQALNLGAK